MSAPEGEGGYDFLGEAHFGRLRPLVAISSVQLGGGHRRGCFARPRYGARDHGQTGSRFRAFSSALTGRLATSNESRNHTLSAGIARRVSANGPFPRDAVSSRQNGWTTTNASVPPACERRTVGRPSGPKLSTRRRSGSSRRTDLLQDFRTTTNLREPVSPCLSNVPRRTEMQWAGPPTASMTKRLFLHDKASSVRAGQGKTRLP